ncbi:unnamed protein product [Linum tenue]|uniref:Uncharacterized protein n=1 Tax=Linum tenue TaxID=586396 RepID=A0AAV0LIR8_9ROSI|nr:unnamed protein product [Linum tenue]
MQHVGKLICSNLGARMDSEPKRWRILADLLYDLGSGLEVLSPLCPSLFLEVAGLGNFAKLVVGPLLSVVHVYSVVEEMKAAPVNTLNPQRTALVVAKFIKEGKVSSPADIRYHEDLMFPGRLIKDAGSVKVGQALHRVIKPSKLSEYKEMFPSEKFVICRGNNCTNMVLEHDATGEDALRGWMVAAYAAAAAPSLESSPDGFSSSALLDAYEKVDSVFEKFVSELQAKGWHTDRFLDGTGTRFAL